MLLGSLEASRRDARRDASNGYPQHMFSWRNKRVSDLDTLSSSVLIEAVITTLINIFSCRLRISFHLLIAFRLRKIGQVQSLDKTDLAISSFLRTLIRYRRLNIGTENATNHTALVSYLTFLGCRSRDFCEIATAVDKIKLVFMKNLLYHYFRYFI